MNLLAAVLLISGVALSFLVVAGWLNAWLDGWDERRDAARRNGAHRR